MEDNPRFNKLLETYKTNESVHVDLYLSDMIADIRDDFLDIEKVSKVNGHSILAEVSSAPEHVLLYVAQYIDILEKELKSQTLI